MRAVLQRVNEASVTVDGRITGQISRGLLVLVGITQTDTEESAKLLAQKVAHLRIFEDAERKMNESLLDISGELLVISQFTLYGDTRKGRRPSFHLSAPPNISEPLYEKFVLFLRETGLPVKTGIFGAHMEVRLLNAGPVTLILET